ncbi:MurR/RpiR family transcriptional regulator [Rossellomorea oryzaecorticis]|uniref:MurR/RpiR family transcriptional regulator n=1 Tax=Rossellomorea oryzaecorticis TaxID=1396505 RepID=A0ABU9K557_9BACI
MKYLTKMIQEHEEHLSNTDLKILDFVIDNVHEIDRYSINKLADSCFVSRTTILRLAKKLGFSGYSEFRSYVKFNKEQINQYTTPDIEQNFLRKDIERTAELLKKEAVENLVTDMVEAKRVYFIGSWLLKTSCYYTAKRLNYYESKFISPQNDEEIDISFLHDDGINENAVVIFLSFSGETPKIVKYAKKAENLGAKTVSITSISKNQLAKLCDVNFWAYFSMIYEDTHNECIASNLTIDYILEEIFLRYLSRKGILNYY